MKTVAEMETMSGALFPLLPLPSCCGFSTATEQVNLYIKGFPSSKDDVKPGRKTRGVAALVTHIKQAFLWTGCLKRSGSWDSGEWRGTLLFKKTEGKKGKRNPAIEGYLSGTQTSG